MILAVDAGNTAVTLGCVEGREILNLARLAASPGAARTNTPCSWSGC